MEKKRRRGERRMTKELGGECSKHKARGAISFIAKHVPDKQGGEGRKCEGREKKRRKEE